MTLVQVAALVCIALAIILTAIQVAYSANAWLAARKRARDPNSFEAALARHLAAQQLPGAPRGPMLVGHGRGFDPCQIPDDAKSVRWEACHLFSPYAPRPQRTPFGLQALEPPLAMVCVECDLRQPVLIQGTRRCDYCGTAIMAHGTRVYFWRDEAVEVEEWRA